MGSQYILRFSNTNLVTFTVVYSHPIGWSISLRIVVLIRKI